MASTKPKGISDEARRRGVSRQYIWQERKRAAGKCGICGKPRVTASYCERHRRIYNRYQNRRNAAKRTAIAGSFFVKNYDDRPLPL